MKASEVFLGKSKGWAPLQEKVPAQILVRVWMTIHLCSKELVDVSKMFRKISLKKTYMARRRKGQFKLGLKDPEALKSRQSLWVKQGGRPGVCVGGWVCVCVCRWLPSTGTPALVGSEEGRTTVNTAPSECAVAPEKKPKSCHVERQNWDCGFLRGNQKYGFSWRIAFPDLKKNVFLSFFSYFGIFRCSIWTPSNGTCDLVPWPGMEPRPPLYSELGVLATESPGKSLTSQSGY